MNAFFVSTLQPSWKWLVHFLAYQHTDMQLLQYWGFGTAQHLLIWEEDETPVMFLT